MRTAKALLLVFLLFLVDSLFTPPITCGEEPLSNTVTVVREDDTLNIGRSFKMSVYASNSDTLSKIMMKLILNPSDVVRFDSISYSGSRLSADTILETRTSVEPDTIQNTIELRFLTFNPQHRLPPDSGKIFDLCFFGIRDSVFFWVDKDICRFFFPTGDSVDPDFSTDSVWLSSYDDPTDVSDTLWIKRGVFSDTVGIKAKFPLPFTAYNDEILSGFLIPLFIAGNNSPTFYDLSFESTSFTYPQDTLGLTWDTTSTDTTHLIKLELKKELDSTLVEPGEANKFFDLWLKADDSAGSCSIYTGFMPHWGNLFFIDSLGGFIPESQVVFCTTFSYMPGDISRNNVVNNVDLFYLAMYLFLPPEETSGGELGYGSEVLDKIKSQKIFQSTPISSEEWDSTFTQIQFRGDVNGDGRVDAGDYYTLSMKFQGAEPLEPLQFGWSNAEIVDDSSDVDSVKINFPKAYPDTVQQFPILIEIYNQNSLAGLTMPLQIPDNLKLKCDSISLAGKLARQYFDWEWMACDQNYDQIDSTQDLLIIVTTLDTLPFLHIPASESPHADSAFILWCRTIIDPLMDTSPINCVTYTPAHRLSFFKTDSGYSQVPQFIKSIEETEFADYGDAPDETNPYYAGFSFPTLYNTTCSRIPGRRGPFHKGSSEWLGTSTDTNVITQEWTALMKDKDKDNLTKTLYVEYVDDDTIAWYIAPVTVTIDPDTLRYLNVLYDVDTNKIWKKQEYTEWVVQNKLIKPDTTTDSTTEKIILGPFKISQAPSAQDPAWARFTLTREPIPKDTFDAVGSWDGSGPPEGWMYGETEDILFSSSKGLTNFECFSVNLDDSIMIPEGGKEVNIMVKRVGFPPAEIIEGLALSWKVFESSGVGDTCTCSFKYSTPEGQNPSNFALGESPIAPDSIIFTYDVSFPDSADKRECKVLWKVSKDLGAGTKLVATDETKFIESAKPEFVSLITLDTISYYGGVVDLRFFLVDPDSDYPILVTFNRGSFEGSGVEYPPIFGVFNDSTKVLELEATNPSQIDSLYVCSPDDTLLFHWAADTTETGTRMAIFKATEMVGEEASIEDSLKIYVSNTLLPPKDKVWVGRKGVIGRKGSSFKVPVEVYNTDSLKTMRFPFKIIGDIDTLRGWSFETSRVVETLLTLRDTLPNPPVHPDTIITRLYQHPEDVKFLAPGFGKIFDLWFTGDITAFQIDTLRTIVFNYWDGSPISPDFESYEIRIIEGNIIRGDANNDGKRTVSDVVYIINYLFKGGPEPKPEKLVGDTNCDGSVSVSDVVYLVNYLFKGGPAPGC